MVVSTHPVCSGVVARYKAERTSALPLVTCVTDITSHSEWIHPGTDRYLVAGEDVKTALVRKGVDAERVTVTGIPVRAQFSSELRPDGRSPPAAHHGRRLGPYAAEGFLL